MAVPAPPATMDPNPHHEPAPLHDDVVVDCPYCGEQLALYLDPALAGTMVHDCEVCCRPWQMTVRRDADGAPHVTVDVS